jgi:hypothetical protein
MKLSSFYEQSPKDYEHGQGFDPDDMYKDVDWDQVEREHEERQEKKRQEAMKAVQVTDGNKYRIARSLVNSEAIGKITTLEGIFPEDRDDLVIVLGGIHGLKNLKGLPAKCQQLIITNCYGLTSMEGCPTHVTAYFTLNECKNLTVDVLPEEVGGDVKIKSVKVPSVKVLPKRIAGDLDLFETGLQSLHNIHKHLSFLESGSGSSTLTIHTKEPLQDGLGVFLMDRLFRVWFNGNSTNDDIEEYANDILEKKPFIKMTPARLLEIQDELIDAGFEDFANL